MFSIGSHQSTAGTQPLSGCAEARAARVGGKAAQGAFRLILALVMAFACTVTPMLADRAQATQPLNVYVGYAGGPYYLKRSYTVEELEALADPYLYQYTVINGYPSLVRCAAWGIPVDKLLGTYSSDDSTGYAVNMDKLWRLAFGTDDNYKPDDGVLGNDVWYWDYYNDYESGNVLDVAKTPRYFFPGLGDGAAYDGNKVTVPYQNMEAIQQTGEVVPTLLALKYVNASIYSPSYWDEFGSTYQTPDDVQNGTERNRLVFGQATPNEQEASNSLHSIHSVYAVYAGRAKVGIVEQDISAPIGQSITVHATITADDPLIAQEAPKDVVWTSSDDSVARVTSNGDGSATVTVVGKGDFHITATYGQSTSDSFVDSTTILGSGPGGSLFRGEGEGEGWGYGSGDGERGPGSGSASIDGTGDGNQGTDIGAADGDDDPNDGAGIQAGSAGSDNDRTPSSGAAAPTTYDSPPEGAQRIVFSSTSTDLAETGDLSEMESEAGGSSGGDSDGEVIDPEEMVEPEEIPNAYKVNRDEEPAQNQLEPVDEATLSLPWIAIGSLVAMMLLGGILQAVYFDRARDKKGEPGKAPALAGAPA